MGSREDFNADVVAHPFLLGLSEHHVRLLADCTILREYCEKDHTLGYQLFKRMSEVMTRRLQLARAKPAEEQGGAVSKAA